MSFAQELHELMKNADANSSLHDETQRDEIFTKWRADFEDMIKQELRKRASRGYTDAHINFDRHAFSNTGLGRPAEMLGWFLGELSRENGRVDNPCLKDIQHEVWNNAKFTVKFSWA